VIGKNPGHHQNCRRDPQDRRHHVDFPSVETLGRVGSPGLTGDVKAKARKSGEFEHLQRDHYV
jgi:hypothetical protein